MREDCTRVEEKMFTAGTLGEYKEYGCEAAVN